MVKNRILIVEDDADISDVISMNLQYSNYEYVAIDDVQKQRNIWGKTTHLTWRFSTLCCQALMDSHLWSTCRNIRYPFCI
jgi:DNA-binding response OmpR family regulator